MRILIIFLFIGFNLFSQNDEIRYSIESNKACIEWSNLNVNTVRITFPNEQKIAIPTLGETRLNMEIVTYGTYLIEFIEDKKTIKTITIEI